MTEPRILFVDLETSPTLGYTWGVYDVNVLSVVQNWYLLAFSCKWSDSNKIMTYSLPGYKNTWRKSKTDDYELVRELWRYFDTADVLVAHNLDRFDAPKANARFIHHGLLPPSPYKTVDTLKVARKFFRMDSNKLNDLAQYLNLGTKLQHTGMSMWLACMAGDEDAWKLMRRYNAKDVALLEQVYLKLRPWDATHTNLAIFNGGGGCPTCQSHKVQRRGVSHTKTYTRQRWNCQSCGSWYTGAVIKK